MNNGREFAVKFYGESMWDEESYITITWVDTGGNVEDDDPDLAYEVSRCFNNNPAMLFAANSEDGWIGFVGREEADGD